MSLRYRCSEHLLGRRLGMARHYEQVRTWMRVRASYDKPRQSGPSVSVCALRARALTPSVSVRLRPPPSHVRLRPSVHHCTPARTLRPFPVSISGGAALLAMKVAHRCCCPLRAASTPIQSDRRAAVRRHFAPAAPARRRRCAARAISVLSVLSVLIRANPC